MDYYVVETIQFALILVFCVSFVAVVMYFKKKQSDNRTKVLLSALEKGKDLNPELLAEKPSKKPVHKWGLLGLLIAGSFLSLLGILCTILVLAGGIFEVMDWHHTLEGLIPCLLFFTIGLALLIGHFVGKRMLKPEIEAENTAIQAKKK